MFCFCHKIIMAIKQIYLSSSDYGFKEPGSSVSLTRGCHLLDVPRHRLLGMRKYGANNARRSGEKCKLATCTRHSALGVDAPNLPRAGDYIDMIDSSPISSCHFYTQRIRSSFNHLI